MEGGTVRNMDRLAHVLLQGGKHSELERCDHLTGR